MIWLLMFSIVLTVISAVLFVSIITKQQNRIAELVEELNELEGELAIESKMHADMFDAYLAAMQEVEGLQADLWHLENSVEYTSVSQVPVKLKKILPS
jgi:hypothetical protein